MLKQMLTNRNFHYLLTAFEQNMTGDASPWKSPIKQLPPRGIYKDKEDQLLSQLNIQYL